MKLGTETGSIINHLHSRSVIGQPEPTPGMGVTLLLWSDRNAGTIQRVWTEGTSTLIGVTEDTARVVAGSAMDGSAEWEFKENPNACEHIFRREPDGRWQQMTYRVKSYDPVTGTPIHSTRLSKVSGGGYGLMIGRRDHYRDPSF